MWQVAGDIGRVRVLGGSDGPIVVPSGEVVATGVIPADSVDRQLVLAERADAGWRANVSGEALEVVAVDDWSQAFVVPTGGGEVEISHRGPQRSAWLTAQLVAVLVALVLALPGIRRERGAVDDAADVDHDVPESLDLPRAPELVPATNTDELVTANAVTAPTRSRRRRTVSSDDQSYVGRRAAGRGGTSRDGERHGGGRRAKGRRQGNGDDS